MEIKFQNTQPLNYNRTVKNPVAFSGMYQEQDSRIRTGEEVGNMVSTVISALILAPVIHFFSLKLFRTDDIIPENIVNKVAQKMVDDNNLESKSFKHQIIDVVEPEPTTIDSLKNFFSDHFNPSTNEAFASKNRPSVILHEIGHGIDWNKSLLSKLLTKTRFWALGAMGLMVTTAFAYRNNDPDSLGNKIDKNIGTISFLSFVPTLITEASASLHGHKYLKQFMEEGKGVTADMLKNYDTRMKWAYGTYLATALLTPVAIKAGVMVKDKIVSEDNNQEMQQSYDWYNNQ